MDIQGVLKIGVIDLADVMLQSDDDNFKNKNLRESLICRMDQLMNQTTDQITEKFST